MSVGALHTTIVLSEPGRIHCGSRDPVHGHVKIRYNPLQNSPNASELFGPLKIHVIFHGRAKTKIWKNSNQSTRIYRGRAPLFAQRVLIYDDSFKAQPLEIKTFPFQLTFPEATALLMRSGFNGSYRFLTNNSQSLPPSFKDEYSGFAHKYEAYVEYRVGVEVSMPSLHVDVLKPGKYQEPIIYYQPSVPRVNIQQIDWRGDVSVSNELLLPEADRPSGFKQKTKALFGAAHFPTYAFDWVCTAPKHLQSGQAARFDVKIIPRESECTAVLVPDVHWTCLFLEVKALTQVRAEAGLLSTPESEGNYTVCNMRCFPADRQPFSKANGFTKSIITQIDTTQQNFSPSFSTFNITQSYSMELNLAFSVTGKNKAFKKQYPVYIYPPAECPIAPAPPSLEAPPVQETPPLPQYEQPPSYSKAENS
ncbi:hypothetical protein GGR57DRAFT_150468 [Xylariaceae sp. FL1272]|nr:hypothetical protein GGR57DRAFT_150468 [Xylariaceae sp. FL1272]